MTSGADPGSAGWTADPNEAVRVVFAGRQPLAERYAEILTGSGIERGLLGPREAARIWDRHLLNSAALADLLPAHARIVDVGSGAGLPGLVLAIRRPDLSVDLVESLKRRAEFLDEAVAELGLAGQIRVIRGRAEDQSVVEQVGRARWVTARAVAPIDRLVRWCLPLLEPGGHLLAMKGRSAAEELVTHLDVIRRSGGRESRVETRKVPGSSEPLSVIVVRRAQSHGRREADDRAAGGRG